MSPTVLVPISNALLSSSVNPRPFLIVFLSNTEQWWALIPTYVMAAIGLMVGLIGLGILSDLLIPAYVMFAIALPFFVVYLRDTKQWWALIPAGIMTAIGILIMAGQVISSGVFWAVLLILLGLFFIYRALRREPSVSQTHTQEPIPPEPQEPPQEPR